MFQRLPVRWSRCGGVPPGVRCAVVWRHSIGPRVLARAQIYQACAASERAGTVWCDEQLLARRPIKSARVAAAVGAIWRVAHSFVSSGSRPPSSRNECANSALVIACSLARALYRGGGGSLICAEMQTNSSLLDHRMSLCHTLERRRWRRVVVSAAAERRQQAARALPFYLSSAFLGGRD
jgi:hypothetical protein